MKYNNHIHSFNEHQENSNTSDVNENDYLDVDKKDISFLIGKKFKTTDKNNWRKGHCTDFTDEEYRQIKKIINNSIIENNITPSKYSNLIGFMFEKVKHIKISDIIIQKTIDALYSVHLREYTGDRDYTRYDETKTFLYQFSFDELKSFLTFLIERINLLSK